VENANYFFLERTYVMVDIVVDSLPITSKEFIISSYNCANNNTGGNCDLFVWRDGNQSEVIDAVCLKYLLKGN